MSVAASIPINSICQEDCISGLEKLLAGSIDLAFADPPFNIGYKYDQYEDRLETEQYLDWSREWISAVDRVLKPDGTFWLAIGDEYAAQLKLICQEIGFHPRSWVIWYYTFGVNCKQKYSRSHAHLFYFVKDPEQFTFHGDDLRNRIPSARQLVYNDKRANPQGRLPDDTWILRPSELVADLHPDDQQTWTLRPQDLEQCFHEGEDTWYFPRVAGTFKERAGFHGCQMPEQLLGRIVRSCSSPGEIVLDPFSGSGTTPAVAKKLGRSYLAYELSDDYVARAQERLAAIRPGDLLDGSPEPTMSAPQTWAKKTSKSARVDISESNDAGTAALETTLQAIRNAFEETHDSYSVDRLLLDDQLRPQFHAACRERDLVGNEGTWNLLLLKARQRGELAEVAVTKRTQISWKEADSYVIVAEIASQVLLDRTGAASLSAMLCDPATLQEFDELCAALVPGGKPFIYRWAAIMLERQLKTAEQRAQILKQAHEGGVPLSWSEPIEWTEAVIDELEASSGLFLIETGQTLYVGETPDLRQSLSVLNQQELAKLANTEVKNLRIRYVSHQLELFGEYAWQRYQVSKLSPRWNWTTTES